jgi:hypothetical protein
MKKFMLIGGLSGFTSGLILGLVQSGNWPAILWRASIAALGAGLLLRWWGGLWIKSLRQVYEQRLAAEVNSETPPLPPQNR